MDSPFPGMDPYVEGPVHWKDFHHRFIDDLSDAIADRLPPNYIARIEQDVLKLEHGDEGDKLVEPDLNVIRVGPGRPATEAGSAADGTMVLEPAALEPTVIANVQRLDPYTQGFIEVRRLPDQELVTVVEVLSRTNKSGEGRGLYLEKRARLLQEPVSLVEVDLLRAGRRLELARPLPAGDYYGFVSRLDRRPMCEVFAWTVRDRLPVLPIPLQGTDRDVRVDLQNVFRATFRRGRYPLLTNYGDPPPPPSIPPAAGAWVAEVAAKVGRTSHG
jgi:hypothetical protein